jgi:hypothetical protein
LFIFVFGLVGQFCAVARFFVFRPPTVGSCGDDSKIESKLFFSRLGFFAFASYAINALPFLRLWIGQTFAAVPFAMQQKPKKVTNVFRAVFAAVSHLIESSLLILINAQWND